MLPILITCPVTNMRVQHIIEKKGERKTDSFEPFKCPACARIHLVNGAGKLLSDSAQD